MVAPLRAAAASYAEGDAGASACDGSAPWRRSSTPRRSARSAFSIWRRPGGFDLLCHHAARVGDYRSPDFDIAGALAENTANLRAVLDVLGKGGLKGVVLTGSVFEQDEGAGEGAADRLLALWPVKGPDRGGRAATAAARVGLPFAKFVIPNPFGPLEEPRFCAYLVRTWKKGETARVNTPAYVRDNIPVSLLAKAYAKFAAETAAGKGRAKLNPSGYVESQGAFAERFAGAMRPRLKLACGLELGVQTDFSEPLMRVNVDSAVRYVGEWDEKAAWDEAGDAYRR